MIPTSCFVCKATIGAINVAVKLTCECLILCCKDCARENIVWPQPEEKLNESSRLPIRCPRCSKLSLSAIPRMSQDKARAVKSAPKIMTGGQLDPLRTEFIINRIALHYVNNNTFKPETICGVCMEEFPGFQAVAMPCECVRATCQLCAISYMKSTDTLFYHRTVCFSCRKSGLPILNVREAAALETRLVLSALHRVMPDENYNNLRTFLDLAAARRDNILAVASFSFNETYQVPFDSADEVKIMNVFQLRKQLANMEYHYRQGKSTSLGALKKLKFNRNVFYHALLANEAATNTGIDSMVEADYFPEHTLDFEIPLTPEELNRRRASRARARERFGMNWDSDDEVDEFYQPVPSYVPPPGGVKNNPSTVTINFSVRCDDEVIELRDTTMTPFHVIVPGVGFYCPICPSEVVSLLPNRSDLKTHMHEAHPGQHLPPDVLSALSWIQCESFGCARFLNKNTLCAECLKRPREEVHHMPMEIIDVDLEVPTLTPTRETMSGATEVSTQVSATATVTVNVAATAKDSLSSMANPAVVAETLQLIVPPASATPSTTNSQVNTPTVATSAPSSSARRTAVPVSAVSEDDLAVAQEKQEMDRIFNSHDEPTKMEKFYGQGLYTRVIGIYGPALKSIELFRRRTLESFQDKQFPDFLKNRVSDMKDHLRNLKLNLEKLKVIPLMDAIVEAGFSITKLGLISDWPRVKLLPYCRNESIDETFLANSERLVLQTITPAYQRIKKMLEEIATIQEHYGNDIAVLSGAQNPSSEALIGLPGLSISSAPIKRTPSAREVILAKRREVMTRDKEFFSQIDFSKYKSYVIEVQVPCFKESDEAEFKEANKGELDLKVQVFFSNATVCDGQAKLVLPHVGSKVQSIKNMSWTSLGIQLPKIEKFVALNQINHGIRLQETRSFAYYNIYRGSIVRIKPLEFFEAAMKAAQLAAQRIRRPLSKREMRRRDIWKQLRDERVNDPDRQQWEVENLSGFEFHGRGVTRWVLDDSGWTERHERAARAQVLGEIMPADSSTKSTKRAKRRASAMSSSSSSEGEGDSDADWVSVNGELEEGQVPDSTADVNGKKARSAASGEHQSSTQALSPKLTSVTAVQASPASVQSSTPASSVHHRSPHFRSSAVRPPDRSRNYYARPDPHSRTDEAPRSYPQSQSSQQRPQYHNGPSRDEPPSRRGFFAGNQQPDRRPAKARRTGGSDDDDSDMEGLAAVSKSSFKSYNS